MMRRDHRGMAVFALAFLLAGLLGPLPAGAQWIEAPGQGWVEVTLFHHDTYRNNVLIEIEQRDPWPTIKTVYNQEMLMNAPT